MNTDISQIQKSKDIWDATINAGNPSTSNFLEIEHDIHYQIAYNLTDYILDSIYSKGYRSVTVGECLGDPAENWYRSGKYLLNPEVTYTDENYPSQIKTRLVELKYIFSLKQDFFAVADFTSYFRLCMYLLQDSLIIFS